MKHDWRSEFRCSRCGLSHAGDPRFAREARALADLKPCEPPRVLELEHALRDTLAILGGCARPYSPEPCGSCVTCRARALLERGAPDKMEAP